MAFTAIIKGRYYDGGLKITYGSYVNSGGGTGGDIDTGIDRVIWMKLQTIGAVTVATSPSVYETVPCDGHAVTIVTGANESGRWEAHGEGD